MGAAASLIGSLGGAVTYETVDHEVVLEKDSRRRNSLAYNIERFINFEGDDFAPLLREVKDEKVAQMVKAVRPSKYTAIGDNILEGNYRELRNQVMLNFKQINRRYKEHFGNTVLHFCCQEGYPDMLDFIFKDSNHSALDDVDVEIDGKNERKRSPLLLCFSPPTATHVGLKFGVGADGNPIGTQPEGIEVAEDWIKPGGPKARERCIKSMIANGANVNEKDYHGFTSLHYACMWGWVSIARTLVSAGADVNAATVVGRTPLIIAVEKINEPLVKMLLTSKDIGIDAADSERCSALISAMEKGEDALVIAEALLKAGADPNHETFKRKCPLSIAVKNENLNQIHLLLDYKARRRGDLFDLLKGEAKKSVEKRLLAEEKAERDAADAADAARNAKKGMVQQGYRNRSPWGAWVEIVDKQDKGVFYYNPVSRKSQKEKPPDFKVDKKRKVKEATFGMHFYH